MQQLDDKLLLLFIFDLKFNQSAPKKKFPSPPYPVTKGSTDVKTNVARLLSALS
jgi:hypothetical protein